MDFTGKLTARGEAILAQALLRGEPLTITRVVAGSGTTPQNAVELAEPRQEATIEVEEPDKPAHIFEQESPTMSTLVVTLAASLAQEAYTLTELGVYAYTEQGEEILYQIYQLDEPVEITPQSRLVLRTFFRAALSEDLEIVLKHPPSGLLSRWQQDAKADLVNGQVPLVQLPRLQQDVTLHVNAAAGSDDNPGTSEAPFATVQAAVDSLPKDLGESLAIIRIWPGTYDEDVIITGFYQGGSNAERPATSQGFILAGSGDATIIRSIRILNNTSKYLTIDSLTVQGGNPSSYGDAKANTGILVNNSTHVVISPVKIRDCTTGVHVGNYFISGASSVTLNVCDISDCANEAVYVNGQNRCYLNLVTGSNPGLDSIALRATNGAELTVVQSTLSATTDQVIYAATITKY